MKPDESTLRDLYENQRLTTRAIGQQFGVRHITVRRWMYSYGITPRPSGCGLANRGIKGPTRDELHRMLHEEHIGLRGVARRYGVDFTAVAFWVKTLGIEPPTVWETRSKGKQPKLDPDAVSDLYEAGMSLADIGDHFGVGRMAVTLACKKRGIQFRPDGFNGTRYACLNGLAVRSIYEQRVAEWLIGNGLEFAYEPPYPCNPKLKADFLANGWYIEVWGVTDSPSYKKQAARKIKLCEIYGMPLVQLKAHHFKHRGKAAFERALAKVLTPAKAQGTLF